MTLLYLFLVSIGLLGKAFKLFGGGFVGDLIDSATNPLVGLFVGVLATTLVQSSSTTTSLVVAMVGSGTMPIDTAIPVVMGANIGTSVTNTGHVSHGQEFRRAFAASTVHDFFNIMAVVILLPLQIATNILGRVADVMAHVFQDVGGMTFASPLKVVTEPVVGIVARLFENHPWLLLIASLAIMFGSLRYLVVTLKSLVLGRVESFFDQTLFKNAGRAMLFGLAITVLVQSSSITTSLAVPLAGAGILSLVQIFPYTLGANVGTTITAMLAALAVGELSAVTVAFAHLMFNVSGIAVVWPLPAIRRIPLRISENFAELAAHWRWIAVAYILVAFYAVPLVAILVLR